MKQGYGETNNCNQKSRVRSWLIAISHAHYQIPTPNDNQAKKSHC